MFIWLWIWRYPSYLSSLSSYIIVIIIQTKVPAIQEALNQLRNCRPSIAENVQWSVDDVPLNSWIKIKRADFLGALL